MPRVLMIHKKLVARPVAPVTWAAFGDYKSKMTAFVNARVSYEGLRLRVTLWPIDGEWTFVIDESTPVYERLGFLYNVHNLDGDRVQVPDLVTAVSAEEAFINANITEAISMFVVEDGPIWLAAHGFVVVEG